MPKIKKTAEAKPRKKAAKAVNFLRESEFVCVKIMWEDAGHLPYWQDGNEGVELTPLLCISVGFVIEESPERITVAQTVSADNHAHRIQIPRTCIDRIEVVGVVDKASL